MDSNADFARIIYIILAIILVGGASYAYFKENIGKSVQMLLIWACLFAGLALAYGMFKG